jgi:hypothetical protein
VARVLALAHHWHGLLRSGAVRDQADLARLVGVSRARVTQVMSLLWLAPGIQEHILCMRGMTATMMQEAVIRRVASVQRWDLQRSGWQLALSGDLLKHHS